MVGLKPRMLRHKDIKVTSPPSPMVGLKLCCGLDPRVSVDESLVAHGGVETHQRLIYSRFRKKPKSKQIDLSAVFGFRRASVFCRPPGVFRLSQVDTHGRTFRMNSHR